MGARVISMNANLVPVPSPGYQENSKGAPAPPSRYIRFGIFHLDLRREELLRDGTRVKLQGKVFQTLAALLEKPGEVVTREALRVRLWPSDTHVNYDANVNTTVNKLRQVLGDSPEQPAFVDTIPRKGYSFVAKIEYLDHPEPRPVPLPSAALAVTGSESDHRKAETVLPHAALHSKWFTAGVITLILAGVLFGAALVLYAHRAI
jgi:DNA-binding winged helix-turn-helix (wHTH) protein